jgi:regulation of enolase protein 1 (concanavalin A-like superfamily)
VDAFEGEMMHRSTYALGALLVAFTVLAAPAPVPFKTGWNKPVDPHHDCKFAIKGSTLTIEVPGSDHDFAPKRRLFNAPRLLRDIEGDFLLQVRVSGTFNPSAKSTVEGETPSVAAGLLLIPDDENCVRLEYSVFRHRDRLTNAYSIRTRGERIWNTETGGIQTNIKNWPQGTELKQFYLRMERRGDFVYFRVNTEDREWKQGNINMGIPHLPAKVKVGLAAYSNSTEPFKPTFDEFKLIRIPKKKK